MTEFHARHRDLFDAAALDSRHVFIAGCGSVGSELAVLLARSGVRRFVLADHDEVTETGLCRTAYLAEDVGRRKVDALKLRLESIRSGLDVDARDIDLGAAAEDDLRSAIASSDLLVAATDSAGVQARLGALSYHAVSAVFPGVYAKGTGGEVIWTRPDETPCFACVVSSVRKAVGFPRAEPNYGVAATELAAEPALGIDILRVTVSAAKIALALLLGGEGRAVRGVLDPARSILFVGNTVDWIWTEPFECVWARAVRKANCVCRIAPGASTADLVDEG
jgi:molybdopterin/thiamine biosynthesis adenylyltransferase